MIKKIKVSGEYIQLNQLLKLTNLAMSGGAAREMIEQGLVMVNGEVEDKIRKKIRHGDRVEVGKNVITVETDEGDR